MEDSDEVCSDCGGHRWLHMGEPFEIQRCDTCSDGSEDEAIELHRKQCGCDWPDVDYQHLAFRFMEVPAEGPQELREKIEGFKELAAQRDQFSQNITKLMVILGEILEIYYKHWEELGERDSDLFSNIQGTGCVLIQVTSLIYRGLWKAHWLWDEEDGIILGEKWFATPRTNTSNLELLPAIKKEG